MITRVDLERLAQGFVVANTPASLLRWYQQDPTVMRMVADLSEDAMVTELGPLLRKTRRSEMEGAHAYALLVAIGLKRRNTGGDFSQPPFRPERLSWGTDIWERIGRTGVSTSVGRFSAQPQSPPNIYGDTGAVSVLVDPNGNPLVRTVE